MKPAYAKAGRLAGEPQTLLVTMGDPAGIGPEITLEAWRRLRLEGQTFAVIGAPSCYARFGAPIAEIAHPHEAPQAFADALPVFPLTLATAAKPGEPDSRHAPAILSAIETAVSLTREGAAAGVVTNPIAKSVLYDAGFTLPGHTEFLAELCQPEGGPAPHPVMMLAGGGLRVALATIHEPLARVPARLTQEGLMRVARITAHALEQDFGVATPRLALAGLNPHAGEGGALGKEEETIINPAAEALRAEGLTITDAQPADALFAPHAREGYDAAIAMYHDQGLIPVKTLDFDGGVNITLGLPIIRTSPDHGTAFSIAGQGRARADSLIAAIRMAAQMARHRQASADDAQSMAVAETRTNA